MTETLTAHSTISHYRIVSKIGAGGMGEVYLAQDTKLDRKVALKILPAELAANHDRMRRFVQEAKAAAALNHPNIAHVYEIGESDGTHFIAMEYIDGETLREKIHRDKAPLSKLLKYLNQVAEGLAKAHAAGIVHRDLKPDNVMITRDGYAKVLDFGLAKLVEPQSSFRPSDSGSSEIATAVMQQPGSPAGQPGWGGHHSTPGMVMGTVGYMSPEQASGRINEIDHRSDIFSFGCLLFEAATGQRAFEGKDVLDSLHKIVHAPTPQLKDANPLAPDDLQRVVRRCLAKEPERRYQSMKEVALEIDDLQHELKSHTGLDYASQPVSSTSVTTSGATRADEGFWVAVLPFKYRGSNVDLEALAEGLSEDILTGLSRFSYLRVVAHSSTLRFATEAADMRTVGKELGARYVMEGSLRQAGAVLRVAVQLVDASTGAHLWAETYDRTFCPEEIFALQDDLVPRIVSTVADWYGVLPHSMSEAVRLKPPDQLSPYEAVLRSFGYYERITPEEHAAVRAGLERAVQQAPGNADGWAMLSMMYGEEHRFGFNAQPDPLGRSLQAARRAVDAAPSNHFAWLALAQALFFRKEFDAFRDAAERAIALNPMDGSTVEYMGHLIAFAGDWEHGCEVAERARQLNPNHPGWYWAVPFLDAYRKGDYRSARTFILKGNQPGHFFMQALLAALYGQLGEREAARKTLRKLLSLKPDFAVIGRDELGKWYLPELVEHLIDGLRKAGLEITGEERPADTSPVTATTDSLTIPGFEGRPAIAVLPFDNRSNDPEQDYFADGLAEDLITRLSLWRSFPVIAHNSSFVYKGKAMDVKKVSADLGVRYVVEGSVRKAGNQVRIAAQLIDASTGQHVWAKTYDRELTDVFAVQDEISGAIAASLVGDLQRAEHQRAQRRAPENLEAWGLYQRALPLLYRFTREDSTQARALLERATALDPQFSTALARLAELGVWDFIFAWTDSPQQALDGAVAQARRAVDLDPRDAEARSELAFALMTAGFGDEALEAALHGLDLNPCLPFALIVEGYLRNLSGNPPEESIELMERAMRLSPHDPAEFLFYDVLSAAYMNAGRYAEGLAAGRRLVALLPSYYWGYLWSAMNAVGLGRLEEARAMIHDARQVHPGLSLALARQVLGAMAPEVDHRFSEALRQAGLDEEREETRREGDGQTRRQSAIRHTVGRETERNELRAAFNGANAGRGSLLCVAGEPGIGKTTLVEDFLAELTADNQGTIARGRCSERLAGTEAYLPLLEALDALLRDNPHRAATLRQLAPTWYAQVASLSSDDTEAQKLLAELRAASQERMKRELGAFLQEVARLRPLILFFDDLHWADVSTIDLLSFLAGKFDALKVLIVVTYRPSDLLLSKHPFLQIRPDLQARGVCRELSLEFLTEAEIAEYLALEFPGHRFPIEFPKLIHAKTEGSPLFMADLVRYLRDRGVIANTSGAWALVQDLPDIQRELPESVRGMIERKIAQLSEEDRKLLTAASVQGYEFDSAVVAQVLNLDADDVEERLEKLEHVFAFVKLTSEAEFPNRTLTLKYRFVHVLYQNTLYGGLRVTRRATLSASVAQSLLGFYGEQSHSVAGELANLFDVARDFAKSAEFFAIAAQNAAQVFANAEATTLARRGLNALKTLPASADRDRQELALQITLGLSLAAATFWAAPEVAEVHRRAQALCQRQAGNPQYFQVLTGLFLHHTIRAEIKEMSELAGQLLQLAEEARDSLMLELAHCCAGIAFHHKGELIAAGKHFETGLSFYRPGQSLPYHHYLATPSVCSAGDGARNLWILGYPDQALRQARQACELADSLSNPGTQTLALHFFAYVHALRREEIACQEKAEAVIAISRERDVADNLVWAACALGWSLARQGRCDEGLAHLRENVALGKSVGVEIALIQNLALMAEALCYAGQVQEALTTVEEALAVWRRNEESFYIAEIHRLRGELLLLNGATEAEAEACFQQGIEIARQQSAKSWELRAATSLARLWQQQGKTAEAQQMLAEIYNWFTEGFDTADLKDAKALLDELQSQTTSSATTTSDNRRQEFNLQVAAVETQNTLKRELLASVGTTDLKTEASHSPSIAVLPFVNISNDTDNEYFCDGLAEELLNALSKIEALHVAARTSSFSFKGKETDIREIGQLLNVGAVLEGSVRKAGNRLRITAQLVNIADGYHLWSERYDRQMEDIFEIQDEISLSIVDALKVKLLGAEKAAVVKRYTDSTEAYQLYLKGRYHFAKRAKDDIQKALEYFQQAIRLDPNFALAYAMIAQSFSSMPVYPYLSPKEANPQAKAAAHRSLEIDPALAASHVALAYSLATYDWNWAEAEREFKRAIKIDPNNDDVHLRYGQVYLTPLGRHEAAIAELKLALELEPLSLFNNSMLAVGYLSSRQLDRALEQAERTHDLEPSFVTGRYVLGLAYNANGMYQEAISLGEQSLQKVPTSQIYFRIVGYAYAKSGRRREAEQVIEKLRDMAKTQYVISYAIAIIYAALDDRDKAFAELERAFSERDWDFHRLNVDPLMDSLRDDPRFADLVRRIGLPQ